MNARACLALLAVLGLAPARPAAADDTGRPGYHFLNLGTGARLEALGGAGTTLGEQADAMDWNPARLARASRVSASSAWFSWLDGVQGVHLAAAAPIGANGTALGLSLRSLSVDEFDNTGDEAAVSQSDLAFAVGGAMPFGQRLSAGLALELIASELADEKATGFAAGAGLDYQWARGWNLACAARHVGSAFAYGDGAGDQLPTQVAAGFAGTTRRLHYGIEGLWENGPGLGSRLGIEYTPLARLALRAGTALDSKPETATEPWSAGAGFEVGSGLSVDYSFRDTKIDPSHRVALRWEPGRSAAAREEALRSGPEFYRDMIAAAIAPALDGFPGAAGDTVVVRASAEHEAAAVVSEVVADALRARGLRPEVRKPVPDLPDSVRAAKAAELAKAGLVREVDVPLLELDIRKSDYIYARTKRERWVGPRSVEREASAEIGIGWKLPGESAPAWTSQATGADRETVELARIPAVSGYPAPVTPSAGDGKPNPLIEPAIVSGIVAGLAFLFFSNRDVGN